MVSLQQQSKTVLHNLIPYRPQQPENALQLEQPPYLFLLHQ